MDFLTMSLAGYYVTHGGESLHAFEPQHLFCDSTPITGAMCPNCRVPLINYLSLDMNDARLSTHIDDLKRLPLLYCWQCPLQYEDFYYKITGENEILALRYSTCLPNLDDTLTTAYPTKPARLISIPSEEQVLIKLLNRGIITLSEVREHFSEYFLRVDRPRHQVFGEPYLSQQNPNIRLLCCSCGKQMPFLCCIADDFGEHRFAEDSWAQILFFYCNSCHIVGAYSQTD